MVAGFYTEQRMSKSRRCSRCQRGVFRARLLSDKKSVMAQAFAQTYVSQTNLEYIIGLKATLEIAETGDVAYKWN